MKFLKGDSIVFIMMILSSSFLVLFTALFSSVEQNVQYSFTVIIECSQLIKQHTLVYIPILVNLWREGRDRWEFLPECAMGTKLRRATKTIDDNRQYKKHSYNHKSINWTLFPYFQQVIDMRDFTDEWITLMTGSQLIWISHFR